MVIDHVTGHVNSHAKCHESREELELKKNYQHFEIILFHHELKTGKKKKIILLLKSFKVS